MSDAAVAERAAAILGRGGWAGYGLAELRQWREYHQGQVAAARALADDDEGRGQVVAYHAAAVSALGAEIARREPHAWATRPAAARVDAAFVADLKRRVPLAMLLARDGVHLKRAGKDRCVGLCPAHREKTASFVVYDDGHYFCFGCGAVGDAYTWLMRDGCDFPTAVAHLAEFWGVSMPESTWRVDL